MSKKNSTLIACVIDRSGSMQGFLEDAVGGFNAFLKGQQEDKSGECKMTLAMFDNLYELKYNNAPIEEVEEFTNASYCPRGSTALDELKEEDKPEKVIFVILTDGQENASQEFNIDSVKGMIKEQQETWKWEFIYLAADDAGFEAGQTMGFAHSTKFNVNNTRAAYGVVGSVMSSYRAGVKVKIDKEIS